MIESYISISVLLLFFIGSGIAAFSENNKIKKLYVGCLFFGMAVSMLIGASVPPFLYWGMFSEVPEANQEHFEMYVEDENNNQILYAPHSAFPAGTYSTETHAENLACGEYNNEAEQELITFLLYQSNQHMSNIESGQSIHEYLIFPSHDYGNQWSQSEMQTMVNLKSLNIYHVVTEMSEDGSEIKHIERHLVMTGGKNGTIERKASPGELCS